MKHSNKVLLFLLNVASFCVLLGISTCFWKQQPTSFCTIADIARFAEFMHDFSSISTPNLAEKSCAVLITEYDILYDVDLCMAHDGEVGRSFVCPPLSSDCLDAEGEPATVQSIVYLKIQMNFGNEPVEEFNVKDRTLIEKAQRLKVGDKVECSLSEYRGILDSNGERCARNFLIYTIIQVWISMGTLYLIKGSSEDIDEDIVRDTEEYEQEELIPIL